MIKLSSQVWESMGYTKVGENEPLHGRFYRLLVYHIEGFKVNGSIVGPLDHTVEGQSLCLAVGESVNEVCRILAGDDLVEDETEWRNKNGVVGPYLVLKLGPTNEFAATASHVREDESEIWTNGGFEEARGDLDELQERTIPLIVSSFTVAFSSSEIAFRAVDAVSFGIARNGKRIRDMRFSMSAYAIVSKKISADEVKATMLDALRRTTYLDRKFAGFHDLALKETDQTRQFLLFFIALELLTKTEFATRYALIASSVPGAILPSTDRKKLEHQFFWLQKHVLPSLPAQCVDNFQRLRRKRNLIAHGAVVSAGFQDVVDVKALTATVIAAVLASSAR